MHLFLYTYPQTSVHKVEYLQPMKGTNRHAGIYDHITHVNYFNTIKLHALAELGTPCWKFQLGTYLCMHDVLAFFPNLRGPPEV